MYVFCDIETTGLDIFEDEMLELAILITDDQFKAVADFNEVLYFGGDVTDYPDVVQKMHQETELWDKCLRSENYHSDVETKAVAFLDVNNALGLEMCGNTIGFDRAFIKREMYALDQAFHYRSIDISSIKILGKRLGWPGVDKDSPEYSQFTAHQALDDCYLSAIELKHYYGIMETVQW